MKEQREINYQSYDGSFYKLKIVDPATIESWDRRGYIITLFEKLYIDFSKVNKDESPTPILTVGKHSLKCPYCGKLKCIEEDRIILDFPSDRLNTSVIENSYGNEQRYKWIKRQIYRCHDPKDGSEFKLFFVEFVQHNPSNFTLEDVIKKRHCLRCNARWEKLDIEVVVTENIYRKDGSQEMIIVVACDVCGEVWNDVYPLENEKAIPRSKEAIFDWIKQ